MDRWAQVFPHAGMSDIDEDDGTGDACVANAEEIPVSINTS